MSTSRHFVHCRECGEVFRPSPYDRLAIFGVGPDDDEITTGHDDCTAFLVRHARHPLETLRPTGEVAAPEGPLWDPLSPLYWEVSNGTDTLLVRGARERMTEPMRYQLVPGRLVVGPRSVEIPESEIGVEIDRALYPGVVAQRKVEAFVAAFKAVVAALHPDTLHIVYDVPRDPCSSIAKLPASALERVIAHARRIFDIADAARVEQHLRASVGDPDAFTVLVHQPVRVER
jgi:hypothetical protein